MTRMALLAVAAAALTAAGCGDDGSDDGPGAAQTGNATAARTDASVKAEEKTTSDDATKADGAMSADAGTSAQRGTAIKVVASRYGRVIADGKGEAFYLFDREKGRESRCYGECAVAWPPVITRGKPRAGKGARARLLGTTKRRNGKVQVTYAGHPLYYYKDDTPGNILCHNVDEFGGLWLVVRPNGEAAS